METEMLDTRILIFAKAPIPGLVKTRLSPRLSPNACAALQAELTIKTIRTALSLANSTTELWCHPDTTHAFFRYCERRFGVKLRDQQGPDLGARMHYAFSSALKHGSHAIAIGCDCPGLDAETLDQAVSALQDHDIVLGPAEDGGYVLIGLKAPHVRLFENIAWNGETVLSQTRKRAQKLGLKAAELVELWDLDRPDDLDRYMTLKNQKQSRPGVSRCSGPTRRLAR